ncbi:MAG: glycosyltransferase family 39 protein, partial [Candidatus Levybacteria bacterium]|nr:glycosyltransferase family 39 protein [Candidatus Levybacteria bacterium]
MQTKTNILLIGILLLALLLRLFGLNWDQGFHLHPDERAIVLSVVNLQFPGSLAEFFSPTSSWNPHFFAYGSFPFYLLRIVANIAGYSNPLLAQYDGIQFVGRVLSALFDTGTVFLLFLLARRLFSTAIGLLAASFYTISVLPIQLSHFYAVDTLLTFFVLAVLFCLIRFYEKPTIPKVLLIGVCFGAALATKISASVLIISVGLALCVDFLLLFLKKPHKPHIWFPHFPLFAKHLFIYVVVIGLITIITFAVLEPYAFIDRSSFWRQTYEQSNMTKSAFTFPYTLQYVGKINYWYEVKNMFLWGLGPILSTISFIGALYFTYLAIKKERKDRWAREVIIAVFFWTYFFIVGGFAIGFMRYLLPIYPLLCLFAAVLIYRIGQSLTKHLKNKLIRNTLYVILYTLLLVWPLSFMHIYSQPNTRVTASEFITQTISPGKILAIEHWDDSLPMWGQENFHMTTLPLYDPDTPEKWMSINKQLQQ